MLKKSSSRVSRRSFLATTGGPLLAAGLTSWPRQLLAASQAPNVLPVTALITAYYPVSHGDVIVSKILEGYQRNGKAPRPGLKLVSMVVEQSHPHDISKSLAERYGVRLCKTIDEAITLGTDKVQVAGVLSVAEHGDYPLTPDTRQKMYPRRRYFDETIATFKRCSSVVPYFNDKHLSYRWDDARAIVDTARQMKIPLLAGSSLPVTWRFPALELPPNCEIESALTVGYGPLEAYGFHALEAHQCMIERRRGGESGVRSVQVAIGRQIRETQRAGDWSGELFAAAHSVLPGTPSAAEAWNPTEAEFEDSRHQPAAYMMTHADGLRSSVIMTSGFSKGFAFACKLKGVDKPLACWFKLQDKEVFGHFSYLLDAFESTIRAGKAVYPIERTLLTTGVLDRCMHLVAQGGGKVSTPELEFNYHGLDWTFANHSKSSLLLPHD